MSISMWGVVVARLSTNSKDARGTLNSKPRVGYIAFHAGKDQGSEAIFKVKFETFIPSVLSIFARTLSRFGHCQI